MVKLKLYGSLLILTMLTYSQFSYAINTNPASINYVDSSIANSKKAGTGISINGNTISTTATYRIGDITQGGVVIYLDETKRHGLVLGLVDVTNDSPFSTTPAAPPATNVAISTVANGIGGGETNTAAIIGAYSGYGLSTTAGATAIIGYAAWYATSRSYEADGITLCDNPTISGTPSTNPCYSFYLPTLAELQLIAANFDVINAAILAVNGNTLAGKTYWSSLTTSATNPNETAYAIADLSTGLGAAQTFTNPYYVRAMRRF
jgi:hypothetical protein